MNIQRARRSSLPRLILAGAAVAAACLLAACQSLNPPPRPPAVTVEQIVDMTKAGVTSQQIIEQIRASHTVYRMQASELVKLKEQGVSDDVINYMQQTYIDAAREEDHVRRHDCPPYYGYGYYWPYYGPYREVIVVEPRHHHEQLPQRAPPQK